MYIIWYLKQLVSVQALNVNPEYIKTKQNEVRMSELKLYSVMFHVVLLTVGKFYFNLVLSNKLHLMEVYNLKDKSNVWGDFWHNFH